MSLNSSFRLSIIKRHLSQTAATAVALPQSFKYSTSGGCLTEEQRVNYDKDGFIVVRKLISSEDLDKYKKRFQRICAEKIKVPGMTVMKDVAIVKSEFLESEKAITKIQDFCQDDELFEYCCLPNVLEYVKSFTGPNVMAMHTMLINKPPDPGTLTSRHPLHQDLYYFPFRPADKIVCAWTAMERITKENGCLVVVPGSHKGQFHRHGYPDWEKGVNKMYYGIQDMDLSKIKLTSLEMEKGDTVFFHPILIHGSGANRTEGFRKAISCHYAASECEYIDLTGTIQEAFKEEVEEIAKRKVGQDIDVRDVWRFKARLAHGERINL